MTSAVRMPAVAGRFYPRQASELLREVRDFLGSVATASSATISASPESPIPALGCIAPHAGYIFSGHVAGALYSRIQVPECCVVLCPNHTGMGQPLATMVRESWHTPLGDVEADEEMGKALLARFPALEEDSAAHRAEHAIEVQLPFLLTRQPKLRVVPIVVGTSDYGVLTELGEALADVIATKKRRALIVSSSDMNHYESDAITRGKDRVAMERVLALDPRGLWEVVVHKKISMCGFGSAVAMLTAAKRMGATSATLVKYATSGDISGDRDQVVGYAGIAIA
jgi:MEMO1 family protein